MAQRQRRRRRGGCRPTTWFLTSWAACAAEDATREAKDGSYRLFPDNGGLKDAGPGTHPSVEAVTRATLFASGSRRATLELAIRTDFQDRTQPPSSSPALCMAPTGGARSRTPWWGGARGGPPPRAFPAPARPGTGPLLPLCAGNFARGTGCGCGRPLPALGRCAPQPLPCSGGCGTVLCGQIS